jgi:hypothetical protein
MSELSLSLGERAGVRGRTMCALELAALRTDPLTRRLANDLSPRRGALL